MTRHGTTLAPDPAPVAPLRLEVAWPALVARGDDGLSSNSLVREAAAGPAGPASPADAVDATGGLRRLRIVAVVEASAPRPGVVRFGVLVEEDGHRRPLVAAEDRPGRVRTVGEQLHVEVDDADADTGRGAEVGGPGAADDDAAAPLLTVVTDSAGRPLLVRGDVPRLAGLGPGAAGRPTVTVAPPDSGSRHRTRLAPAE